MKACIECGRTKGHAMSCDTGNRQAMKRQESHVHAAMMDMEAVDRLKNMILELCLQSGLNSLECLSAVRCVSDGLTELIEEQTGGEVVELGSTNED